jgi:CubicO group peptidase (beta-lactamase class C family)
MATSVQPALAKALEQLPVPVSADAVQSHLIVPPNVLQAHSTRAGTPAAPVSPISLPKPQHVPTFDGGGFCTALHNDLKSSVAGYAMRMKQHGSVIYTLQWNWAKEPQDGGEGWTPDVRMHVASCSKLVTAIAMTKLLDERQLTFGTKIAPYLPTYWTKGPNVDQITFADLLTHTSGLHFAQNESPSDYAFMKQQVAIGTTHVGTYDYQNMNFGLCRILLATLNGNIDPGFAPPLPGPLLDNLWDITTVQFYEDYLTANVFGPGKVRDASLAHEPSDALAYTFPVAGNGWNSGDTTAVAGGAGWHLTVDDLLGIMGAFRRDGTIVSPAQAQTALDAKYGIDWSGSTALGNYYAKNGGWGDSGGHVEQCVAFFLPQDIELVVFVNSPVGTPGEFLMGQVLQHYTDNVK